MNTVTIKIPDELERELIRASTREHLTKSELIRRAIAAYVAQRDSGESFVSALDQAGELAGCFAGGPANLSSNPEHLNGFGQR